MEPSRESRAPRVFALLSDSIVLRIFRLWRIGTSDINSTPPATTVSHWPAAIIPTARKQINNQLLSFLCCRMLKFNAISICLCKLTDHGCLEWCVCLSELHAFNNRYCHKMCVFSTCGHCLVGGNTRHRHRVSRSLIWESSTECRLQENKSKCNSKLTSLLNNFILGNQAAKVMFLRKGLSLMMGHKRNST